MPDAGPAIGARNGEAYRRAPCRYRIQRARDCRLRGNPLNRCYLCKHNLFTVCEAKAGELGIDEIVDGLNLDDLHDYRPGMQAATKSACASAGRSRDDQGRRARTVARDGVADLGSSRIAVPVVALSVRHRNNARRASGSCGGREAAAFDGVRGRARALPWRCRAPGARESEIARVFEPAIRETIDREFKRPAFDLSRSI